jgi:hypothetical protein
MLGRPSIFRLEIEAVLDQMFGPANMPLPALPLLGRGCAWAFGRIVKPTFHDGAGHEVTDQVRQDWSGGPAAFDAWYAAVELRMERSFLAGPDDDEEMELREHGWRPESTRQIVEGRAAQEQEQVGRLDAEPRWRRGRLFDVVAAREVLIELNEALWEALDRRGKRDLDGLFDDRVAARRFIRMMPSTEVAVELKRAAHRNSELGWITNDVHDIDAMSIAVPYADVVVTEKHMHHVLHAADLPQRMGTVVLRRMSDVALHL